MFLPFEDSNEVVVSLDSTQIVDWGVHSLFAEQAWKQTRGAGITVAVIDTGGSDHPDLKASTAHIIGDLDTAGHGTHVAGIIGACNNSFGVVGVAPECSLLLIKALPGDGAAIGDAVRQAVDYGADIINMSLGAYEDMDDFHDAIKYAHNAGVVVVAAAGNDPTRVSYPGAYPEVIAVTAFDEGGHRAPFAPLTNNHIGLPGMNILSTWLDGQYARLSGTSQATPLLTGCIALILSLYRPTRSAVHDLVSSELQKIDQTKEDIFFCPDLELL